MSARNQQTNRKTVAWLRPLSWSVVALLTLGQEVLAEPDPSTTPRTSTPLEIHQSCWHPGRSANIGIAEPSCDTPMAKANRPTNAPNDRDKTNPQNDPQPTQPH